MLVNTMKNPAYQLTDDERLFALNHLSASRDMFVNTIRDLGENLWYRKPGPGEWSTAECAEHILQTELYYFEPLLFKSLAEDARPERRSEVEGKDGIAVSIMEERAFKVKGAPWEEIPDKKVDKEALIADFLAKRNAIIDFLKTSDAEFRVHYIDAPGMGLLDAYQFILYISAHTNRHTGQIQDIIA